MESAAERETAVAGRSTGAAVKPLTKPMSKQSIATRRGMADDKKVQAADQHLAPEVWFGSATATARKIARRARDNVRVVSSFWTNGFFRYFTPERQQGNPTRSNSSATASPHRSTQASRSPRLSTCSTSVDEASSMPWSTAASTSPLAALRTLTLAAAL